MGIYIGLYKFTDQGIKNIKDAPARVDNVIKATESLGGKVVCVYSTMGEYDYVAIAEFPDDEAAVTQALAIGSAGNVRTTTLKAFPVEKFKEIVAKLP